MITVDEVLGFAKFASVLQMRLSLITTLPMPSVPPPPSPDRDQLKPAAPPESGEDVSVIASEQLFAGRSEVRVRHRGQEYRLRITRQGKLILTK